MIEWIVCVVGPVFDSMSPTFLKSRASQAAGTDVRLSPKMEVFIRVLRIDTICAYVR